MTQTEFVNEVNRRIDVARQTPIPSSLEFYQAIINYISQLESIRDSATSPYEDIVLPPFPAI